MLGAPAGGMRGPASPMPPTISRLGRAPFATIRTAVRAPSE